MFAMVIYEVFTAVSFNSENPLRNPILCVPFAMTPRNEVSQAMFKNCVWFSFAQDQNWFQQFVLLHGYFLGYYVSCVDPLTNYLIMKPLPDKTWTSVYQQLCLPQSDNLFFFWKHACLRFIQIEKIQQFGPIPSIDSLLQYISTEVCIGSNTWSAQMRVVLGYNSRSEPF